MNKLRRPFLLSASLLCALASAAAAEGPWLTDWEAARQAAQGANKPVLLEFHAVWCYSCYYMESNVLSKPAFLKEGPERAVLLKLDVDTDPGREWKEKLQSRVLPSFFVLDASGRELGRIIGEQTEKDFLAQFRAFTGGAAADALGSLRGLLDRRDLAGAGAERERLRAAKDKALQGSEFKRLSLRLDLAEALEKKDAGRAGTALKALLPVDEDCELVPQAMDALELAPALKGAVAARFEPLVERRVFGRAEERCADLRSTVMALAEASPDAKKAALLRRTVALLQKNSAKKGIGTDRNLDDNLRYFLEAAGGKDAELGELYPKLVEAYPSDYVYAYRWAKWLHGRKEHARALELAEKAWKLSYGANRFTVTGLKARILAAMGQRDEAEQAVRAELKAGRGRFPKDAVALEKVLAELR